MLSAQPQLELTETPLPVAVSAARLEYLKLAEWQEYVESHPASTVFHHRRWIETIQQHYGLDIHIPCLKSGGQIEAAMPFLSSRLPFGRVKLSGLPFTDCLSILSTRSHAAEALVAALRCNPPRCDSMRLRTDNVLPSTPSASHAVRHEVALSHSFDAVRKMFKTSVHRNLQKAQRSGLQFARHSDANALEAFYRLHVLTRRKLGVPVQPRRFFELLQERVLKEGMGYVGLVLKAERPVAAGVFLTYNNTTTYKYAASDPAALADRPNDWLVYNALQLAQGEGYQLFDFGISDREQEGLRRFKCNWGAREIDVHTVQIVGRLKPRIEKSSLFKLTSCVIRNTPSMVCRCLGEVLYRYAV
jgi:CelD/BcsL family acetyltransferase involved in cellulose biosynthesis